MNSGITEAGKGGNGETEDVLRLSLIIDQLSFIREKMGDACGIYHLSFIIYHLSFISGKNRDDCTSAALLITLVTPCLYLFVLWRCDKPSTAYFANAQKTFPFF